MVETNKSNVLLTTYTERERQVARQKILLFVNEAPHLQLCGKSQLWGKVCDFDVPLAPSPQSTKYFLLN